MGMSIEDIEQWARQNNYTIIADEWWEAAQDTINKYHQLQADYETRLKADMVAMLENLKADIEAKTNYYEQAYKEPSNLIHETAMCGRMFGCGECEELIQQKINAFKENKNERFNT